MKLILDTDSRQLTEVRGTGTRELPLYSKEAFELLSEQWVKVGWDQKYSYTFSWLGVPVIQLPEDMIRIQEVIYRTQPDVIVETGVAHGGSLVYYASVCKVLGKGRVIGVDLEIRKHNRQAIESHPLSDAITLIEGDSVDPSVVQEVRSLVHEGQTVLVILDSCHTKDHVAAELAAYHELVTVGSYIVATDGLMDRIHDVPRGEPHWKFDNPAAAAKDFAAEHPEFVLEPPTWIFNESELTENITHWPGAWLRRVETR
jgi:cephalosporin hydroxylase